MESKNTSENKDKIALVTGSATVFSLEGASADPVKSMLKRGY
jgi:hypothetical protein